MTTKKRIGTVCFYVIAIVLAVVAMIPFLWMISTSFKSRGALMAIPIEWIPEEPTLDAYIKVFSKFPFAKTIGNSLFISVSYTVITLLSSSMAAFAFAKLRFPGNNVLLRCYLATMMIPTQVTMIPLFVIMNKMRLIDSYASVIMPSIFRPFAVFMLVQQMRTIRFCLSNSTVTQVAPIHYSFFLFVTHHCNTYRKSHRYFGHHIDFEP